MGHGKRNDNNVSAVSWTKTCSGKSKSLMLFTSSNGIHTRSGLFQYGKEGLLATDIKGVTTLEVILAMCGDTVLFLDKIERP